MFALFDPLLLETGAVLAVAAFACLAPRLGARAWRRLAGGLDRAARRPLVGVAACALAAGLGSAAVALLVHRPEPRIHDEFSYLLAADTFARGRIANPPHPCWESFETFHVLQQPTYASKFPPGQGLILAAGRLLGDPLIGVWLSAGLMCGAVCWMLFAWVPPRWALAGGLIAAARFGVASYWSQSYWGGALAAAGGALVFGALPRLFRGGGARDGVLLGAGLVVLALTRPFEGFVLALPVACVVLVWAARRRASGAPVGRALAGMALVLAAGAGLIGMHNRAVTGDPLRLPYLLHDDTYAAAPRFVIGGGERALEYRNDTMRAFWGGWTVGELHRQRSPTGFLREARWRLGRSWRFFLTVSLSVPLLFLPRLLRDRWMRFAAASCALVLGASLLGVYHWHHYLAPVTAPLLALVVGGLRHLGAWRPRGRPAGRGLVAGLLAVTAALALGQALTRGQPEWRFEQRRADLQRRLAARGEPALVLVRYVEGHSMHVEWVYNGADIDAQRVVWARDLGPERNAPLLAHMRGREVYELEVGAERDPPLLRKHGVPVDPKESASD